MAYDPQDRDRVALECRAGFVAPPARYMVTRPPEVGGREPADGDGWGSAWDDPAEDDHELAALERLAALRDRGALSEEEFQRQKARMRLGR